MASDPVPTESIERDGKQFRLVREGKATILVPHGAKIGEDRGEVQQVFYNPIQQYNRDLSVLAIKTYGEEVIQKRKEKIQAKSDKQSKKRKREETDDGPASLESEPKAPEAVNDGQEATVVSATEESKSHTPPFKILDALSASGLRAMRYAHEIPFVTSVKANDLSASATESIKQNVSFNGLDDRITVTNGDALALMYRAIADDLSKRDRLGNPGKANKFDVVDLDPYGTAAPFFDAALQAVRDDGGLLCITCTDSAVWAGHSYCEKTFALYGGTPVKGMHSHEVGLRLVLNAIATSGARYGLSIEPLLSLSIDFYTKFFIKVTKSPQAVKFLGAKTMVVYSCDQGCQSWEPQYLMRSKPAPNKKGNGSFYKHGMALAPTADQLCQHCGMKMHLNGPMYGGHIHSPNFIRRLLAQIPDASPDVYGTLPRLQGMLQNALEEYISSPEEKEPVDPREAQLAQVDLTPFFVIPTKLASVVSCQSPTDDLFRGALIHLGYRVGRSHCKPGSIKTDAPWSTIWWIMTEWIRQRSPIKASKFKPTMPGWKILNDAGLLTEEATEEKDSGPADDLQMEGVEPPATGDTQGKKDNEAPAAKNEPQSEMELRNTLLFNDELARLGRQRDTERLVRYQMNPRADWGPMAKAKGK